MIKKIDKLLLLMLLRYLAIALPAIVLLLIVQYLLKYFDDLAGKDISIWVYVKLICYFAINMTPLSLNLAIMVAALMTYGSLGEHSELTAMRAAGISSIRLFKGGMLLAFLLCVLSSFSNAFLIPQANLKAFSLLHDMRRKKTAFYLQEKQFYSNIPGYSMRVDQRSTEGDLTGIMIYDHSQGSQQRLILADRGHIYQNEDENYLRIDLSEGHYYVEKNAYNKDTPWSDLFRNQYKDMSIYFDLSSFQFKESAEKRFSKLRYGKQIHTLFQERDSMQHDIDTLCLKSEKELPQLHVLQGRYTDSIRQPATFFSLKRAQWMPHLLAEADSMTSHLSARSPRPSHPDSSAFPSQKLFLEGPQELLSLLSVPKTPQEPLPLPSVPKTPQEPLPLPSVPKTPQEPLPLPSVPKTPQEPLPLPSVPKTPQEPLPLLSVPKAPQEPLPLPSVPKTPQEPLPLPSVPKTPQEPLPLPSVPKTPQEPLPLPSVPKTPQEPLPLPSVPKTPQEPLPLPSVPKTPQEPLPLPSVPKTPQEPLPLPSVPKTPQEPLPLPSVPKTPQEPLPLPSVPKASRVPLPLLSSTVSLRKYAIAHPIHSNASSHSFFPTRKRSSQWPSVDTAFRALWGGPPVPSSIEEAIKEAALQAQVIYNNLSFHSQKITQTQREQYKHEIEAYNRFSVSVSCVIMFLIGAAIGSISKKGGMGLSILIAVFAYITYYVISTMAKKYAIEGLLETWAAAWTANAVLSVIAIISLVCLVQNLRILRYPSLFAFLGNIFSFLHKNKR